MADTETGVVVPWADLGAYRADYRARYPVPSLASVVPALAERKQWLMWRYEPGETETAKPRKMPYYANARKRVGKQGDLKDRGALVDYETILQAVKKHDTRGNGWDGVGFAFLPDDGLVGIDLDGMIDPESGEISERCAAIIAACETYTEFSPSGKGVHIIGLGHIAKSVKDNGIGVEVFCGGQFFTFTGHPWPGCPHSIETIPPKTLSRLEATVLEAKKAAAAKKGNGPAAPVQPSSPPPPSSAGGRQRSVAETVALAEEALRELYPGDYNQWIKVGHACKASLGSAGYMVWDAWSAKAADKYAGSADTAKRWNSFQPNEVDIGAVFAMAEESGWVAPWTKARARAQRNGSAPPAAKSTSTPSKATAGDAPPADPKVMDETLAEHGFGSPDEPSDPPEPPDDRWEDGLITKRHEITPCLANAELILSHMPTWKGVIAYDEFAERTVFRKPVPFNLKGDKEGEWSDHLDVKTTIWMQRAWGVEFSPQTVAKAVESMARDRHYHPVREALAALEPWDGIRRNGKWLSDYLGVEETEYTALVGTFFLRGMIQRVMRPGCKFDYCMVLEGGQGIGKSSVCRLLAWKWFCDTDLDLSNKDSLLALPGHWVYEIAELGSLMKAEERKQKSFLSRQDDEFRPPYGQRLIKVPRQNVFIGTTNEEEYLKDATGGRRFWPVMCGDSFNLDGLREALPQMYAEALADFHAGERAYPSADEQAQLFTPEQAKRGMQEPFEDILQTWVEKQGVPFSMAEAAMNGLNLSADKLTPAIVTRMGIVLKRLGCRREEHRLAADPGQRRLYLTPAMARKGVRGTEPAQEGEIHDYC